MAKNISILGSTGSVGTQTLEVIKRFPDRFRVVGLSVNRNIELLEKQIKEFKPLAVSVADEEKADELRRDVDIEVFSGIDGVNKIAALNEADCIVTAVVGSCGLEPTVNAIRNKKDIALANKETLVAGGSIVMNEVKKHKVSLMPIDSEHSAIFQCLNGENKKEVSKIILTCSGGAFRDHSKDEMQKVTLKQALAHPTWNMGGKITIDSSTLMNKGFEVIEAYWLYNVDYDNIDVVVHPQSIVHSMVEFVDGSIIAQLGVPSMKIPIQYALSYPERLSINENNIDITEVKKLEFEKPDTERFPCLKYAYDAGKQGGTMPAVMNAANEIAVAAFLKEKIQYIDIPKIIKQAMDNHKNIKNPELDDILEIDRKVKEELRKKIM